MLAAVDSVIGAACSIPQPIGGEIDESQGDGWRSSFAVDRRRARRGCAAPGADILGAQAGIFLRRGQFFLDFAAGHRLVEEFLQVGPAPAAAGPSAIAVGKLSDPLGLFYAQVIDHLPLVDVKTEAQLVVEIHT